jgi:hypothetical protein
VVSLSHSLVPSSQYACVCDVMRAVGATVHTCKTTCRVVRAPTPARDGAHADEADRNHLASKKCTPIRDTRFTRRRRRTLRFARGALLGGLVLIFFRHDACGRRRDATENAATVRCSPGGISRAFASGWRRVNNDGVFSLSGATCALRMHGRVV